MNNKSPTPRTDTASIHTQAKGMVDYLGRAVAYLETHTIERAADPPAPPIQPYKYLLPYEIEDASIFFGPDAAGEDLYQAFLRNRLTILHGPSGSGKTSLLNASLSPRLIREGRLPVCVHTYQDPIRAIKRAIAPPSLEPWPGLLAKLTLHQFLKLVCDHFGNPVSELVLILDQFEEFLNFWPERQNREPFFTALSTCYHDKSLPLRFIIALRRDHFSDLAQFQEHLPNIFHNQYRLEPLTRGETWDAITGPLTKLDQQITYEPALLETLLADLSHRTPALTELPPAGVEWPGTARASLTEGVHLPELQIVCTQLFETLPEGETTITRTSYEELGNAQGILSNFLQDTLDQLPAAEAFIAKQIMKELISSQATRRVLGVKSLLLSIEAQEDQLLAGLEKLVKARLLRHSGFAGDEAYELAHDYLVPLVTNWIDRTDLVLKQKQELALREVNSWLIRDTLIPQDRLELLHVRRHWLTVLDDDARVHILRSSLHSGYAIEDWAEWAGQDGKDLLAAALNDPRDDVRQTVARILGDSSGLLDMAAVPDQGQDLPQQEAETPEETSEISAMDSLITNLGNSDPKVRQGVAIELGQMRDTRALAPLLGLLADDDRDVCVAAVTALGQLDDPRAVDALIYTLQDEDPHIRLAAIRGLGDHWELPALSRLGDKDRYVGWAGAKELGELGDPRAVQPLISVLRDEHRGARRAAAAALIQIGQPAVEPLIENLTNKDWDVRQSAAMALGEIADPRALKPLTAALQDEHADVHHAAASALVKLGEAAVDPLISNLKRASGSLRATVAEALGDLGNPRAVGALTVALRARDNRVRSAAADALVKIGQPAMGSLIIALRDTNRHTRLAAIEALGVLGDHRAIDPLIAALQDEDPDMRRAAVTALNKINDPRTLAPIIAALQDEDRFVRREATWALGQLGDPRASQPLIAALEDEDRGVRQAASGSLVNIGEAAFSSLQAAMPSAGPSLRWAIIGVLGQFNDPRASQLLASALTDGDRAVRRAAAAALGKLSNPHAVEPLTAALLDTDSGVRWAATAALGEIADPRTVDALIAALTDKDASVRRAATKALKKIGTPKALAALS